MAQRRKDGPRRGGTAGRRSEKPPLPVLLAGVGRLMAPPVASALLLTAAFPPVEFSALAYVALAPLVIGAVRAKSGGDAFWAALVGGLLFFGANLYWVQPITTVGYATLVPYLAVYWALFGWGLRRLARATRAPLTLLAPVLWVALEYVRGWMLSGLPWIYVGHTQYANLTLIQTADALGAYGASFLCLMTSGLAADLLVRPLYVRRAGAAAATASGGTPAPPPGRTPDAGAAGQQAPPAAGPDSGATRISRTAILMVVLTASAWAATIGYGLWRLGQTSARPGPVVASVQTCVPQEIKQDARLKQVEKFEEEMIEGQLALTDKAVAEAAAEGLRVDLVVWPETMVPGIMSQDFLEADLATRFKDVDLLRIFDYLQGRSRLYWSRIQKESRDIRAPILFGAHNVRLEGAYRLPGGGFMTRGPRMNTAFLVSASSKPFAPDHTYSKVHLVPFGEYVPFTRSWPWLYEQLKGFTPYEYDYSLTPGDPDQAPFGLEYDGRESRFQVAICYEDAMAYRIRDMTRSADPARPKAIDFLVNISNDGWFHGSIELDQHLNLCVFRAVENRVAVVRSVNTGISALIAPSGRIEKVVESAGNRRYITGEIVGRLTLDERVAPYTRLGDLFAQGCLAATAGLALAAVIMARRRAWA